MKRAVLVLLFLLCGAVHAAGPADAIADAALEPRLNRLAAELRCLVCQNQSIDDSDASLAVDLRRLVRERIAAGDSDQGIRDLLVARYGDFVLLKPPLSGQTILLWSLPGLALLLGSFGAFSLFRRSRRDGVEEASQHPVATTLSESERRELDEILSGKSQS